MKTDRELLELAAKAAGIEVTAIVADGIPYRFGGGYWNPLTDDGDALRLAVKLRIAVASTEKAGYADCDDARKIYVRQPIVASDRQPMTDIEAVRRAIVRAAAAIGESMP